jgi:predicted anti-sigma-YlaC factor YlaD
MTWRGGSHPDELISASLSGDLTNAERAELDAHLARCERCRATLAAFTSERRILSGMPIIDPPRDLSARVRSGIEGGRSPGRWWRRPGGLIAIGAAVATVAAAILAIVVFSNFQSGPVGQASGSPEASLPFAPSATAAASTAPSVSPTAPPAFLAAGQLGYLSLNGGSQEPLRLTFVNDATGASIDAGTVSGPPVAAALSPDGEWLAYITQKGETGAHEVWALHIPDGRVTPVGCSLDAPFMNRLAWSPDNNLAFTLVAVDLGPDSGCPDLDGAVGGTDAWIFEAPTGGRGTLTYAGNAFAGSFVAASVVGTAEPRLLVSWAAERPWTGPLLPASDATFDRIEGIFLPLISPDGNRAIFWNGTMAQGADGVWQFSRGGMPQLSGDFRSAGPASPWVGTPLFTDLTPVGGEAFAFGDFTWGADSDLIAFWDGAWTGAPQSADGTYPSQQDVYVGRISTGLLRGASKLGIIRPDDSYIVDVAFSPDGKTVAVTIGLPSAGIGDPPSAYLEIVPLDGSTPHSIGGGADPPPWNGPAVFGR